ncbi:hypothetical protein LINPERPRIM_LOCUS13348 [Linum perenne]
MGSNGRQSTMYIGCTLGSLRSIANSLCFGLVHTYRLCK